MLKIADFLGSLTIFAKVEWMVDFSQREGLAYKGNYRLTEINHPNGMQKLSKKHFLEHQIKSDKKLLRT